MVTPISALGLGILASSEFIKERRRQQEEAENLKIQKEILDRELRREHFSEAFRGVSDLSLSESVAEANKKLERFKSSPELASGLGSLSLYYLREVLS